VVRVSDPYSRILGFLDRTIILLLLVVVVFSIVKRKRKTSLLLPCQKFARQLAELVLLTTWSEQREANCVMEAGGRVSVMAT
jgi:hypothetical protein